MKSSQFILIPPSPTTETLKTINGVAEYAVQKFNAENDKGMKLRLTNINGVQTQIVGGVNYMLNLSVVTEEGRHLRVTSLIYDHFGEYSMSDFHFY